MGLHSHEGAADHQQTTLAYNKIFFIAILANAVFVIIQIIYAHISNSSALLADAFHNLGDVLGLVLAWFSIQLGKRKPTQKTSYGFKKTTILAALFNAILLVFSCGIIVTDSLYKLFYPSAIQSISVMIVAGIGIVVNGLSASLFLPGSADLNIRGAYLHLFYDALISVGVVISAALLYWTGWLWLDPVMAIIIVIVILKGTWSLFKQSFMLIIDGVPTSISWIKVSEFLLAWPGVREIHDLHIWAMSTVETALSVHLYMPEDDLNDESRAILISQLETQFGIQHVTIQTEKNKGTCSITCQTHQGAKIL